MIAQITNSITTDMARVVTDLWPSLNAGQAAGIALGLYYIVKAVRNRTSLGQHPTIGPLLSFLNMEPKQQPSVTVQAPSTSTTQTK